jgi:L-asparaginase II
MLSACQSMGWPVDYRPIEHPLQQGNRSLLDEVCQVTHSVGIDGCSVPTFFGPLSGMARAWSVLSQAMSGAGDATLGKIGWAMHRQPFFVSGTDRLDLHVTQHASEPLAVKVGAEGLFCMARPERQQGIAVKVHSGNNDALAVAVQAVLQKVGVSLRGEWPWANVLNVRGVVVGRREALQF